MKEILTHDMEELGEISEISQAQRTNIERLYSHEVPRVFKIIETKSKMLIDSDKGEGRG